MKHAISRAAAVVALFTLTPFLSCQDSQGLFATFEGLTKGLGGFNEEPSEVSISCLRDPEVLTRKSTGVHSRAEAQVVGEMAGFLKAPEVPDFRDDAYGRIGTDVTEAAEPRYGVGSSFTHS